MSAAKHTPGPWEIDFSKTGYPYAIKAPNEDNHKAGRVGISVLRWASFTMPSSAEALANARLIAAAPELLEALRGALKALDAIGDEMTVGERYTNAGQYLLDSLAPARAAIAKATGEPNA